MDIDSKPQKVSNGKISKEVWQNNPVLYHEVVARILRGCWAAVIRRNVVDGGVEVLTKEVCR